jgi:hypothetical protein
MTIVVNIDRKSFFLKLASYFIKPSGFAASGGTIYFYSDDYCHFLILLNFELFKPLMPRQPGGQADTNFFPRPGLHLYQRLGQPDAPAPAQEQHRPTGLLHDPPPYFHPLCSRRLFHLAISRL